MFSVIHSPAVIHSSLSNMVLAGKQTDGLIFTRFSAEPLFEAVRDFRAAHQDPRTTYHSSIDALLLVYVLIAHEHQPSTVMTLRSAESLISPNSRHLG
jgi:alkanesulfonate monooxygenase SsuD/methylene tetrahydromethanopterin reductase-like flavin-dependent oxidoreductase (luciferase family)